jgi:oligoribonuclease
VPCSPLGEEPGQGLDLGQLRHVLEGVSLPAGVPEPAGSALGAGQDTGVDKIGPLDRLDDQLGDAVAPSHVVGGGGIQIDQEDLELIAVAGVDQPRGVEAGDAVLESQPAPGLYEARVPRRNGHGHARRDQRPSSARREQGVLPGQQIGAGVALACIRRWGQIGIETEERHGQHDRRWYWGRPLTSSSVLVWMDLEMTGLDPASDVIVEIATLVTDDDLVLVAEGPDLVVSQPAEALAKMNEHVRQMHTTSGLLGRIEASTVTLADAGAQTLAFIRQHATEPRTVPLAGNSIGTDRRFLAAWLPEIDEWLHYRSVDVSTVKELARRWYPEVFAAAPTKVGNHRALDDIRESVAELVHYRANIFR